MIKNKNFLIEINELPLSKIKDISTANTDVCVKFDAELCLNVIVGTLQNLQYLMEKDKVNFWEPNLSWVIVQKLTKEIIHEAIQAYKDAHPKGYWLRLKFYHFATNIDITVFDQLQAQEIKRADKLELQVGLNDLKAKINELDNLEKSNLIDNLDNIIVSQLTLLIFYLKLFNSSIF